MKFTHKDINSLPFHICMDYTYIHTPYIKSRPSTNTKPLNFESLLTTDYPLPRIS